MEPDLLTVPSSDLSLTVDDEQAAKSDSDGLHVLTSGVINMDNSDANRINGISTFPSELSASDLERDGEITLHSSLIPENAILMETPRGLMLTVPDGITYEDISPNESGSRPMLSCVPVSFFKTCDVNGDGESSLVCDDVSVVNHAEALDPQLQVHSPVITTISKGVCNEDGVLQTHDIQIQDCIQEQSKSDETMENLPAKRKGGWPKGKRRKIKPEVTGPRAPVTGYVLYAIDRRKEIKQLHPELSFTEITKILGQEWSTMPSSQKDKFLDAAEKDKKRYREELKAFRSSETYQETMNKKMLLQDESMGSNSNSMGSLIIDDEENSNELHCKVCNVYFSSRHNKQEHMYGRTHLQNVTAAVEKEAKKQQQEQGLYNSLVVSEDVTECLPTVDDSANWPSSADSSSNVPRQSGPVDIHNFMLEFIQKNYEREQEISILRKHLNRSLQENLIMCKDIQDLQDYHCKLQEEIKTLSSTTSSLIVQSDALKMIEKDRHRKIFSLFVGTSEVKTLSLSLSHIFKSAMPVRPACKYGLYRR